MDVDIEEEVSTVESRERGEEMYKRANLDQKCAIDLVVDEVYKKRLSADIVLCSKELLELEKL